MDDLKFTYVDENGNNIPGEFLYETQIEGKNYAVCNLHYGHDKNDICACKIIGEGNNRKFAKLDQSDNVEAIMTQLNKILMEAK